MRNVPIYQLLIHFFKISLLEISVQTQYLWGYFLIIFDYFILHFGICKRGMLVKGGNISDFLNFEFNFLGQILLKELIESRLGHFQFLPMSATENNGKQTN